MLLFVCGNGGLLYSPFECFCFSAVLPIRPCSCLLLGNTTIRHCGLRVVICIVYIVLEVGGVLDRTTLQKNTQQRGNVSPGNSSGCTGDGNNNTLTGRRAAHYTLY